MNKYENTQDQIPSGWGFFWLKVLYLIPIVGFIFLIIHSFDSTRLARRNHARSYWCDLLVLLILGIIAAVLFLVCGFNPSGLTELVETVGQ